MKNIKKGKGFQCHIFALLITFVFVFQNCQKEDLTISEENQISTKLALKNTKDKNKLDVCHYDKDTGFWELISISINAIPAHLRHGDVVIDEDKDGFAVFNECHILNENGIDCDDTDSETYPGAQEISDDGIDNDCDGAIDVTYIPDDNFEQALMDMGYDIGDLDNYVPTANISTITYLDVSNRGITDLTGIKDFSALTELQCHDNLLTNLNLKKNTALSILNCNYNQLTSLDLNANTSLTFLRCNANSLTSLDVSTNTALTSLGCAGNELNGLNVSANTALTYLRCPVNNITSLDVSANTALETLFCGGNPLTDLDLGTITTLTLFRCLNTYLTNLDVSSNTFLAHFHCEDNPYLTCIKVNSTQLNSIPLNWLKDETAYYSLTCP